MLRKTPRSIKFIIKKVYNIMEIGLISSAGQWADQLKTLTTPLLGIYPYKIYVDEAGQPLQPWATENPTLEYSATDFPVYQEPFIDFDDDATPEISGLITPDQFNEIASTIFDNGTYFSLENGKLLIELAEENVQFKKENFDIQVFASGSQWSNSDDELEQLHFTNDITNIQNDEVERYLSIKTDRQISDSRIAGKPISDLRHLKTDPATRDVISTREFLIRDLYQPEEDICD
mgnify:CR=1 FL=1